MRMEKMNDYNRSEFNYKGLDYIFTKEDWETDWTLIYVGNEDGRISLSKHADPKSWRFAGDDGNPKVSPVKWVNLPIVYDIDQVEDIVEECEYNPVVADDILLGDDILSKIRSGIMTN